MARLFLFVVVLLVVPASLGARVTLATFHAETVAEPRSL